MAEKESNRETIKNGSYTVTIVDHGRSRTLVQGIVSSHTEGSFLILKKNDGTELRERLGYIASIELSFVKS